METVEIKCPKSILNVAKRAKKAKTATYQALERVRDEEAAGSNPVIPTKIDRFLKGLVDFLIK